MESISGDCCPGPGRLGSPVTFNFFIFSENRRIEARIGYRAPDVFVFRERAFLEFQA